MQFQEREFIPVVLGGDINTYSVARAFYEQYQVKTYVFAKFAAGPSYNSKITIFKANPNNENASYFLRTINHLAKQHADKKIILLGCADHYVSMICKHRGELAENIITPYNDYDFLNELQRKDLFYELCEKHHIDYPDTLIITKQDGLDFEMPFSYPVILKPSESVTYWEHGFPGQKKIYIVEDRNELNSAISDIYGAGYESALIIQDMIPGNDENMRVLTSYSDQNGSVKMMCLGHTLLEEHTPTGMGNHALIITEPNKELMLKAKALLEDIHYIGFSNFDIKYDCRDGKYKFFEINTRQGRSNYYVTASGFNIAKYLVEEYVYGKDLATEYATEEHLWTVVPRAVAFRYVKDKELKGKMRQLFQEKKAVNPLFFQKDLRLKRLYAISRTYMSHFVKFKKYYH